NEGPPRPREADAVAVGLTSPALPSAGKRRCGQMILRGAEGPTRTSRDRQGRHRRDGQHTALTQPLSHRLVVFHSKAPRGDTPVRLNAATPVLSSAEVPQSTFCGTCRNTKILISLVPPPGIEPGTQIQNLGVAGAARGHPLKLEGRMGWVGDHRVDRRDPRRSACGHFGTKW